MPKAMLLQRTQLFVQDPATAAGLSDNFLHPHYDRMSSLGGMPSMDESRLLYKACICTSLQALLLQRSTLSAQHEHNELATPIQIVIIERRLNYDDPPQSSNRVQCSMSQWPQHTRNGACTP